MDQVRGQELDVGPEQGHEPGQHRGQREQFHKRVAEGHGVAEAVGHVVHFLTHGLALRGDGPVAGRHEPGDGFGGEGSGQDQESVAFEGVDAGSINHGKFLYSQSSLASTHRDYISNKLHILGNAGL